MNAKLKNLKCQLIFWVLFYFLEMIQRDEQNVMFTTSFPIFYVNVNLLEIQRSKVNKTSREQSKITLSSYLQSVTETGTEIQASHKFYLNHFKSMSTSSLESNPMIIYIYNSFRLEFITPVGLQTQVFITFLPISGL